MSSQRFLSSHPYEGVQTQNFLTMRARSPQSAYPNHSTPSFPYPSFPYPSTILPSNLRLSPSFKPSLPSSSMSTFPSLILPGESSYVYPYWNSGSVLPSYPSTTSPIVTGFSPSENLNIILIAILLLVALDLLFVRPSKP